MVDRSAPLLGPSEMMVCTKLLPKMRVPTSVACLWSCNAPATISEADAVPTLNCKIPPAGVEALGILGIAARHGDNLALIQECTRYRDRLIDQPPGIVTQIDDEAFELPRSLH